MPSLRKVRINVNVKKKNLVEVTSQNDEYKDLLIIQPSQWINVGWFILPLAAGVIYSPLGGLALVCTLYKYLEVLTWKYTCRLKGIEERKGVFNVLQEEVQYFRIKSIMVEEPFLMRLVGLSIVHIISSERFKPNLILYGIRNGEELKNKINTAAYEWRKKLGIRDYDLYGM
jgi:membrane protein YdbS with pleckstrin-like domain